MQTATVGPPEPGPLLRALLDDKVAYLSDHGNYLAVASDGIEVCLCGPLMDREHVVRAEAYLADHPAPKDW